MSGAVMPDAASTAGAPFGVARRVGERVDFGAPRARDAVEVAAEEDDNDGDVAAPPFTDDDFVARDVLSLRAGMANSVQSRDVCRRFGEYNARHV
ncbi:hypothetical protein UC34_13280 [Pandoraea vervacti]|uniref:Uncharacterized protein n=1 Tax=Pandoraea vervacti TaxID=656178 RepID=A0ABM5SYU8_9BURK|nr:hypothetical protein [Pandoraea vervacti]AJP57692.1 hypothetical protein UC34_13280 [Pandoraea vervacti]